MEAQLLEDGCMTINQAVKFSGIGRTSIYKYMTDGDLPYTQVGTRRLIPKKAIVALLSRNLTNPDQVGYETAAGTHSA